MTNEAVESADITCEEEREWTVITNEWTRLSVDNTVERGIELFDFDEYHPKQDIVLYAVERGLRPRPKDLEVFWAKVISCDFRKVGDLLIAKGVPTVEVPLVVKPSAMVTLKWAYEVGLCPRKISYRATSRVLIQAAELGMRPYQSDSDVEPCWNRIQESGDYAVIRAFLEAGVREFDPTSAIRKGDKDLIALYEKYEDELSPSYITYSDRYIKDDAIVIPEGVRRIGKDVFVDCDVSSISLPDSLRTIDNRAFTWEDENCPVKHVIIPKGVQDLGYGAFFGVEKVTVYDTINPNASYALDSEDGWTSASVGWLGVRPPTLSYLDHESTYHYGPIPSNDRRDCEIEVRSSETGQVMYRVYMPTGSAGYKLACVYATSWGQHASFVFSNVDSAFEKLTKKAKIKTAINRLAWPVDLSDERRACFEKYLGRFAKDAVKLILDSDDIEVLKRLEFLPLVTKSNVKELLSYAREGERAPQCETYLSVMKDTTESPVRRAKSRPPQKASTSEMAIEGLDEIAGKEGVLRADLVLDCRESDLDSALYRRIKPGTALSLDVDSCERVMFENRCIGRIDEKYAIALEPFAVPGGTPAVDEKVRIFVLSAKGGMRKPVITVSIFLTAGPKSEMVRTRLIVGRDGSFKPKAAFIKREIAERKSLAEEESERRAAEKRAQNKPQPIVVKGEDEDLVDSFAGRFPMLVNVGGGNSMSSRVRKAIETLEPGDPIELQPSNDCPEYSNMLSFLLSNGGLEEVPYVGFAGYPRVGYLDFGGGASAPVDVMNAICRLAPYLQLSVQEMVPTVRRAKNAKSPKLVVRIDLDYDNLIVKE